MPKRCVGLKIRTQYRNYLLGLDGTPKRVYCCCCCLSRPIRNGELTPVISGSRFPSPRLTKWPPAPVLIEKPITERIRLASDSISHR